MTLTSKVRRPPAPNPFPSYITCFFSTNYKIHFFHKIPVQKKMCFTQSKHTKWLKKNANFKLMGQYKTYAVVDSCHANILPDIPQTVTR